MSYGISHYIKQSIKQFIMVKKLCNGKSMLMNRAISLRIGAFIPLHRRLTINMKKIIDIDLEQLAKTNMKLYKKIANPILKDLYRAYYKAEKIMKTTSGKKMRKFSEGFYGGNTTCSVYKSKADQHKVLRFLSQYAKYDRGTIIKDAKRAHAGGSGAYSWRDEDAVSFKVKEHMPYVDFVHIFGFAQLVVKSKKNLDKYDFPCEREWRKIYNLNETFKHPTLKTDYTNTKLTGDEYSKLSRDLAERYEYQFKHNKEWRRGEVAKARRRNDRLQDRKENFDKYAVEWFNRAGYWGRHEKWRNSWCAWSWCGSRFDKGTKTELNAHYPLHMNGDINYSACCDLAALCGSEHKYYTLGFKCL